MLLIMSYSVFMWDGSLKEHLIVMFLVLFPQPPPQNDQGDKHTCRKLQFFIVLAKSINFLTLFTLSLDLCFLLHITLSIVIIVNDEVWINKCIVRLHAPMLHSQCSQNWSSNNMQLLLHSLVPMQTQLSFQPGNRQLFNHIHITLQTDSYVASLFRKQGRAMGQAGESY